MDSLLPDYYLPDRRSPRNHARIRRDNCKIARSAIHIVTSLFLGCLVFQAIMWGVWGAPVYKSEYWALLGSIVILLSAPVTWISLRYGAVVALAGLVPLCIFYAPRSSTNFALA